MSAKAFPRLATLLPWLAPACLLAAVLGGVALVQAGTAAWFGVVLVALAVVPAAWVLVSALFPGRAERVCPACGTPALARASPGSTHGLACRACGWEDESASAWLLAEEEEAELERIVLAERAEAARERRLGAVDPGGRPG
jgi:hypothetical protein